MSKDEMQTLYDSFNLRLTELKAWGDRDTGDLYEDAQERLIHIEQVMRAFVTDCLIFHDALYKEHCFTTNTAALPREARFAITLQRLLTMPRDDYRGILTYVRDEMGEGADYDTILQLYGHIYADAFKESIEEGGAYD